PHVRDRLSQPGARLHHAPGSGQAPHPAQQCLQLRQSDDQDQGLHDGSGAVRFSQPGCGRLYLGRKGKRMRSPDSSSPLWKDEFSVNTADERYVTRRQFSKFLVLTSVAMFVGQLWILVKSWFSAKGGALPKQVIAGRDEVGIGEVKLFAYPTAAD